MKPGKLCLISALLLPVLIVAACGSSSGNGGNGSSKTGAPVQALSGNYLLYATYDTKDPTPQCDQLGGVKTGDGVTVRDATARTVATGTLGSPQTSTRSADLRNITTQLSCNWPFTTGVVPKSDSYQVQVAKEPPRTYSFGDVVNQHWSITIEEERNITGR